MKMTLLSTDVPALQGIANLIRIYDAHTTGPMNGDVYHKVRELDMAKNQ